MDDESAEGEDPREALEVAYQRMVGALHGVREELAQVAATRRRIERDLGGLSDADDASQLRARHAEALARQDALAERVDALRDQADRCRVERDRVRALADSDAARQVARDALARLGRRRTGPGSAPASRNRYDGNIRAS